MTYNKTSHLVIVPTYNEVKNIEKFLKELLQFNVSVLVVDDNSPDGTADVVSKMSENYENIYLKNRSGKLGLGSAYRAGFKWGLEKNFNYLIEMDADFSHRFADLESILNSSNSSDVVIGSRYIRGGGSSGWDFKRKLLSKYANLISMLLLRSRVRDMTSGFRCYSSKALELVEYYNTSTNGYSFQIEMTLRSVVKKLNISEIPILFTERELGNSKMSQNIVLEAVSFLLKNGIRRWLNLKIM